MIGSPGDHRLIDSYFFLFLFLFVFYLQTGVSLRHCVRLSVFNADEDGADHQCHRPSFLIKRRPLIWGDPVEPDWKHDWVWARMVTTPIGHTCPTFLLPFPQENIPVEFYDLMPLCSAALKQERESTDWQVQTTQIRLSLHHRPLTFLGCKKIAISVPLPAVMLEW